MAVEIERKFLVVSDAWRETAHGQTVYRQGYLSTAPSSSVRVRIGGDRAWLNLKSATDGVSRMEFEYPIPLEDAREIIDSLCVKPLIEKTRFIVEHDGHSWEVDVFEGDNDGLVVAEVELQSADEAFSRPSWVGEDVSDDVRYYNQRLVEHPYCDWAERA